MQFANATLVPGTQLQMEVRALRQPDVARVHHDEAAAALRGGAHLHADDRMGLLGVRPHEHDHVRLRHTSSMEFVIAPEPSMVARPATVGACQTRAQQSTLFVWRLMRAIFWNR